MDVKWLFGYYKFGNFCEYFIFANSVERHVCHVKNSRLWHDLLTSVNDSDTAISGGFYCHETSRNCAYLIKYGNMFIISPFRHE